MWSELLDHLLAMRRPKPLFVDAGALAITDLPRPTELLFSVPPWADGRGGARVARGDAIEVGQPLWEGAGALPCPVAGTVAAVEMGADIRAGRPRRTVRVEALTNRDSVAFPPLDPGSEASLLAARVGEAGVLTCEPLPRRLSDVLAGEPGSKVIVLAADREPAVRAASQLLRERTADAMAAAVLLSRIRGSSEPLVAVPEALRDLAAPLAAKAGVGVLAVPARYPETLEPLVASRAGGGTVVALDTALAALDAVRDGKVPDAKVLTVVGPQGTPIGNFRVALGTRLRDLLGAVGLEPGERDKVVAGGPMRGFAQFSLETAVDAGVDAVVVVASEDIVAWTRDPCINCGHCLDVCPVRLQVHLITRYAEYGLFDRAGDLDVRQCIDCGLCAWVCTTGRPLDQLIRLAKDELAKAETPAS